MSIRARREERLERVAKRRRDLEMLRLKARATKVSRAIKETQRDVERLERERERTR